MRHLITRSLPFLAPGRVVYVVVISVLVRPSTTEASTSTAGVNASTWTLHREFDAGAHMRLNCAAEENTDQVLAKNQQPTWEIQVPAVCPCCAEGKTNISHDFSSAGLNPHNRGRYTSWPLSDHKKNHLWMSELFLLDELEVVSSVVALFEE